MSNTRGRKDTWMGHYQHQFPAAWSKRAADKKIAKHSQRKE